MVHFYEHSHHRPSSHRIQRKPMMVMSIGYWNCIRSCFNFYIRAGPMGEMDLVGEKLRIVFRLLLVSNCSTRGNWKLMLDDCQRLIRNVPTCRILFHDPVIPLREQKTALVEFILLFYLNAGCMLTYIKTGKLKSVYLLNVIMSILLAHFAASITSILLTEYSLHTRYWILFAVQSKSSRLRCFLHNLIRLAGYSRE